MAQSGIPQAVKDKFLDLTQWTQNMIVHLQNNFQTQKVWPKGEPGPYIGYGDLRESKRSTGDAFNSIYASLWAGANGDTEKISFFFNYYLYFVDMGVGSGFPITKVNRDKDAQFAELYEDWKEKGDRQSRPIIGPELRHQLDRLSVIVCSYYGDYIQNEIVSSFEDNLGKGTSNK